MFVNCHCTIDDYLGYAKSLCCICSLCLYYCIVIIYTYSFGLYCTEFAAVTVQAMDQLRKEVMQIHKMYVQRK